MESRNLASSAAYKSLFSSDIPVIVCNPATTPLETLRSDLSLVLRHGNAILVVVSSPESAPEFSEYATKQFPRSLSVVFVDPTRALAATRTLSAEPGSSVAVQRYQDNFSASGVSKFTSLLAEKLAVTSHGVHALYALTAREQIKTCLASCQAVLKAASREVDEVHCAKYSLQDQVTELEARVATEVLGAGSAEEVKKALSRAKQEVKVVMDELTWWRCIWRVDDVGDTVKTAVDSAWCRELESRVCNPFNDLAGTTKLTSCSSSSMVGDCQSLKKRLQRKPGLYYPRTSHQPPSTPLYLRTNSPSYRQRQHTPSRHTPSPAPFTLAERSYSTPPTPCTLLPSV